MAKNPRSLVPPNNGKPTLLDEQHTAQAKLRTAVFNGVSEDDVKAIVQGIVKRAKEGDPGSVKNFFDYVLGGRVATAVQNNIYVEQIGSAEEPDPVEDPPGSPGRIEAMRRRIERGEAIFSSRDASFGSTN